VLIKNFKELARTKHGSDINLLRKQLLRTVDDAIGAVEPKTLLKEKVALQNSVLRVAGRDFNLERYGRLFVIGAGKASVEMTKGLIKLLQAKVCSGEIAAKVDKAFYLGKVRVNPASHPVPDERSMAATERILRLVSQREKDDLFIFVLSGGASAMLAYPRSPVTLKEKAETTSLLLKCGASIDEINCVRKHISAIKGGLLQRRIHPATSLALIISDVVGNALDTIASGPTYPDNSTFAGALAVLKKYDILNDVPKSVSYLLHRGVEGKESETPKPGDKCFDTANNVILGSGWDACLKAAETLRKFGHTPVILTDRMQGEAREIGRLMGGIASSDKDRWFDSLVMGGETTVTVNGSGVGGRNQELCLAASIAMKGAQNVVLASVGTDGIDGFTDAAGALVDGYTYQDALEKGVDAEVYLQNNDSGTFFKKLSGAVLTGPTGTNVSDLVVMVAGNFDSSRGNPHGPRGKAIPNDG
jgi:glycerate 2-kinase